MIKYETDPIKISKKSSQTIKELLSLDHLNELEQEITIQMVQASGDLTILENLRFSETAVEVALEILSDEFDLLCDSETVACGIKQKYLKDEPICLMGKANVISQAKAKKQTRSMTAVDLWKPYLADSIVLIGSESTALLRLLEVLEEMNENDEDKKPALIIATPVGFTGATEAKNYLWENQEKLGVPCITLLGTRGSSNLSATAINTLLKMHHNMEN